MTTSSYRWAAAGQITAVCLLGLFSAIAILYALPEQRSRRHFDDAVTNYLVGTDVSIEAAQKSLDSALANDPHLIGALALRGRIALLQDNTSAARAAYRELEQALFEAGQSTAPALNGLACTLLFEAERAGAKRNALIREAYKQFQETARLDPKDGEPRVNAGICCLLLGTPEDLIQAASQLAGARRTRNLPYDALVSYYAAEGSMLGLAAGGSRKTAAAVAEAFGDPDPDLWKSGRMLQRSAEEFEKASDLVRDQKSGVQLLADAMLIRAEVLVEAPRTSAAAVSYWGRAPLSPAEANAYWNKILNALGIQPTPFTVAQRQFLRLAIAISMQQQGRMGEAVVQIRRAASEGPLSPEFSFYAGAVLFRAARELDVKSGRRDAEKEALPFLQGALKPGVPAEIRFRAAVDLAVSAWEAKDPTGALSYMEEARAALPELEVAGRETLGRAERARFHRHLGMMLYEKHDLSGAAAELRTSLELDDTNKPAAQLLAALTQEPSIGEAGVIDAARLPKLPPATPIVTVQIVPGGPRAVEKREIAVMIDGQPAAFHIGPSNRVYAMAGFLLAQGKHSVTVTITPAGKRPVTGTREFKVSYVTYKLGSLGGGS